MRTRPLPWPPAARLAIRTLALLASLAAIPAIPAAKVEAASDPGPGGESAAAPATFRVEWPRPGPLLVGVPVDVSIVAVDAGGAVRSGFDGRVGLEGIYHRTAEGLVPLRESPPAEAGVVRLEGVDVPQGRVAVLHAGGRVEATRPVLPGYVSLVPPLLAILLAVLTRQVLISLFCGLWAGVLVIEGFAPVTAFLRTADTYLTRSLADEGHASIILFSLSLAGLVGIITRVGGVRGLVDLVSRYARGARSGQLATWLLGLFIFFDDYANALIVGNTMRPFTDRVRISREKLSFIVDATAAPVATIGVISTWTAYQLGLVAEELPDLPSGSEEPYIFFLRSIPYSFYSFLMLLLVLLCAATLRDFGPMRRAERRTRVTGRVLREGSQPLVDPALDRLGDDGKVPPRWYNAVVPILCIIVLTIVGLWHTGREALPAAERSTAGLREIMGAADAYRALLWAALAASLVAGILARVQGLRVDEIASSWVSGARSLVIAAMILVLAWAIGDVCRDLQTGPYVVFLTSDILSPRLVPVVAFVAAGAISFSTGTSYGTMAILVPMLLPLPYQLAADAGLAPATADTLGVGTLAAILGGAVFGDHCSPISDTTVLSSMAAGADHVDHVRTQLPYAALGAAVAVPCYLAIGYGAPVLVVIPAALVGVALLFLYVSRGSDTPPTSVSSTETR